MKVQSVSISSHKTGHMMTWWNAFVEPIMVHHMNIRTCKPRKQYIIYAIVQESKWHRKARVSCFCPPKMHPTALVPPWHSAAYQLAVSASWLERCFGQKNSSFATKCELVLNIRIGILSLSIKSMTRKTGDGSQYLAIFGCSINFPMTKFQLCLKFLSPSKTQRCPVAIAKEVPLSGYQKSPRKNPLACLFFHGSKRRLHPPQFCADLQLQQPRAWESKEEEWLNDKACWKSTICCSTPAIQTMLLHVPAWN